MYLGDRKIIRKTYLGQKLVLQHAWPGRCHLLDRHPWHDNITGPSPNPVNPSRKCRHHGSYAWFIHFKLIQYNPRWKCRELASFSYYATSERHKISGFIGLFPDPDLSKQTITHADLLILRTKWYTFHMGVVSFNFPAVCGGTCLSLLENCFDSQIQVVLLLRRV